MAIWIMAVTTIDGKLTGADGGGPRFGSALDHARLMRSRARADAVVLGAGTIRAEDRPPLLDDADARAARARAGRPPHPAMVVLSGSLDLPIAGRAFGSTEQTRVVATAASAPADRRAALEARGVKVIVCGEDAPEPGRVIVALAARGWRDVVVEGGGGVNAAFLEARQVDEIHLTIAPAILGGRSLPTLVDGAARRQGDRLQLALEEATPQPTGEIFTRWRVL